MLFIIVIQKKLINECIIILFHNVNLIKKNNKRYKNTYKWMKI